MLEMFLAPRAGREAQLVVHSVGSREAVAAGFTSSTSLFPIVDNRVVSKSLIGLSQNYRINYCLDESRCWQVAIRIRWLMVLKNDTFSRSNQCHGPIGALIPCRSFQMWTSTTRAL